MNDLELLHMYFIFIYIKFKWFTSVFHRHSTFHVVFLGEYEFSFATGPFYNVHNSIEFSKY